MKVFIIGTGNVARSMGWALIRAGHQITGVLGRNPKNVNTLSGKFKCQSFGPGEKIPLTSDFYIIAAKDDVIAEIAGKLPPVKGIILHTSGTIPLSILSKSKKRGVLYPVDSITGKFNFSFKKVPICIEAGDEASLKKVMALARTVSENIFLLDSSQRTKLHLAAVFTNNFTNHLLGIATGILDKENLPHELLYKLAQTTLKNAFESGPLLSQTGPAKRNDKVTIQKHIELLKTNKLYSELYKLMTTQIQDVHNKN